MIELTHAARIVRKIRYKNNNDDHDNNDDDTQYQ